MIFFVDSSFSEVKVPEVSVNEYNNTFNQLNTATKDLVRKLPFLPPFQTMEQLKQLVILVSVSGFMLRFTTDSLTYD